MAYFTDPSGTIIEKEDMFDPKTGENIAVTDFMNQVKQKGGNVTPINIFQDSKGTQVAVPYGREKQFLDLGLKPIQQLDVEQKAQQSKNKLLSGDIEGYHPSESSSFLSGYGEGAGLGLEPQAVGAIKGAINVAKGGKFMPAYREGRDIEEGLNKAAQKENPYSYAGGDIAGNLSQAVGGAETTLSGLESAIANKIPFDKFGRTVAGASGLGAIQGATQAANQGQDIIPGAEKGAEYGAIGGVAGHGVSQLGGLALKGAGNLIKGGIAPEARQAFVAGLKGTDYSNPELQEQVLNKATKYKGNLEDTIDEVRKLVGKQQGDYLQGLGDIDHSPVKNSLEKAYSFLDDMQSRTGDPDKADALNFAKNKVIGALDTLEKNPNDAKAVQDVKKDLDSILYKSGEFNTDFYPISQVLNEPRTVSKNFLEGLFPNELGGGNQLRGTNQAYKDILEAQNAKQAYDKVIPDLSQMESLSKGNKTLAIQNRINNLMDFNKSIQNNKSIPQDVKDKLGSIVDDFGNVINESSVVKKAQGAGGLVPSPENQTLAAAKVGSYLNPNTNRVTGPLVRGTEAFYNNFPKAIYDALPANIQQVIRNVPGFGETLLKNLPQTVGQDYLQNENTSFKGNR